MTRTRPPRQRPPRGQPLAVYDLPGDLAFPLRPIGVVRSPFRERTAAPRQAVVGTAREAVIILRPGLQNALKDLIGFARVWVLYVCHHSRGWRSQLVPPRDTVKRGLFATRSPDRPNPLGLSAVEVVRIYGCHLTIRGVDMLDGTPVVDLKPYIPAYDSFPGSAAGWVDALDETGPDHRGRE